MKNIRQKGYLERDNWDLIGGLRSRVIFDILIIILSKNLFVSIYYFLN